MLRACTAVVWLLTSVSLHAAPDHPLDALTEGEYGRIHDLLRAGGHLNDQVLFADIRLQEPHKSKVLAWQPGEPMPRYALAIMREGVSLREALIDLAADEILSVEQIEDQQAGILLAEWQVAQDVTKADRDWRRAMRERGYRNIDPAMFNCLPLTAGYFAEPEFEGKRLLRVQCLDISDTKNNIYHRPIENLTAVVDLNAQKVIKLVDEGAVPTPPPSGDFDDESVGPLRAPMKPLLVTQPDGPSFTTDGSFIKWGSWRFHTRLDRRRGTIISLASFDERSVLYQASLSEMWVPYMDPAYGWFYKSYFDAGEYGFGMFSTPLVSGVDCPDYALYLNQQIVFDDGKPATLPNSTCIFERPTLNPAWRHSEAGLQVYNGRPARELVVRMASTIGNYDYLLDYVFMPTGAVRVDIASTGIDIVKAAEAKSLADPRAMQETRYGNLIAPHLVGVFHDHFFSFRFDVDVDGQRNDFVRDRIVPTRLDESHPRRSIWTVQSERVRTEDAAKLSIDMQAPEQWRIQNTSAKNKMGYQTGYVLMPSANALPQISDDDYTLRRAGFARHHLWVTPYNPDELYAAGDYPNQSKGEDGLPTWTAANRSIDGEDLVLWYTLGFHHITAAEDWPVLPSHPKRVTLRPFNFFDRSQVIDLAAPK
ncbi:MAG: tyramine oxidase [Pseudomonadota bacterium]